MKLDRNSKIALGATAIAGLWFFSRGKKKAKIRNWYKPGATIRLPAGGMTTLRIPAGRVELVGDESGLVVMALDARGENTLATVLAADTAVPLDSELVFIDVDNPSRLFKFYFNIEPTADAG